MSARSQPEGRVPEDVMGDEGLLERLRLIAQQGLWDWPEWGYDAVIAGLGSDQPILQVLALESATEAMNEEIGDLLLKIVQGSATDEVRSCAALAFAPALEECQQDGDIDRELVDPVFTRTLYQRIRMVLRSLYYDPNVAKLIRRRALEASARAPMPWHEGAVRSSYLADDEEWQQTAVICMGFVPGFERELLEVLETGTPELRYEAVAAAENARLAEAGRLVQAIALDEESPHGLRVAAARAIPYLVLDAYDLLQQLVDSGDEEISRQASLAMAELMALDEGDQ